MLAQITQFPFAGSQGFLAVSADPVTIIRRNADGSALVRMDPRPHESRNRDASGNRQVPLADLFETAEAAAKAGMKPKPREGRARK